MSPWMHFSLAVKKLLERASGALSLELFCLEMTKQLSNLSNNIHQVLKEGKERYTSQPHPLSELTCLQSQSLKVNKTVTGICE